MSQCVKLNLLHFGSKTAQKHLSLKSGCDTEVFHQEETAHFSINIYFGVSQMTGSNAQNCLGTMAGERWICSPN